MVPSVQTTVPESDVRETADMLPLVFCCVAVILVVIQSLLSVPIFTLQPNSMGKLHPPMAIGKSTGLILMHRLLSICFLAIDFVLLLSQSFRWKCISFVQIFTLRPKTWETAICINEHWQKGFFPYKIYTGAELSYFTF